MVEEDEDMGGVDDSLDRIHCRMMRWNKEKGNELISEALQ